MTHTIRTSLVAGLVALTAFVALPVLRAQAGPPQDHQFGGPPPGGPMGPGRRGPGGPMGMLGPMMRELDLTDAQREQVRSIMESHRDAFQQVGEKMRTAREGMGALIDADTLDEDAIRSKSREVAAAEADSAILNAKARAEVFGILTAEQQEKARAMKAARPARQPKGRH